MGSGSFHFLVLDDHPVLTSDATLDAAFDDAVDDSD